MAAGCPSQAISEALGPTPDPGRRISEEGDEGEKGWADARAGGGKTTPGLLLQARGLPATN